MDWGKYRRPVLFYMLAQVVIWIKVAFFFQSFGFGQVTPANRALFPSDIVLLDFLFHQSMHALITVSAFSFARKMEKINDRKLLSVVLAAVAMHNIAYWFTNVFETAYYLLADFASDAITLYAFIIMANYLSRKYEFFRKMPIPLLH